jgi:hypothetical protein
MNKYYLDKPEKKSYTNMKIEAIMAEITDAKLNKYQQMLNDIAEFVKLNPQKTFVICVKQIKK